jgi:hypothetical protein
MQIIASHPTLLWPALLLGASLISGCGKPAAVASAVNQDDLCFVSNFAAGDSNKVCSPGQKVVYMPAGGAGNPNLVVMFAAANCDLRYAVVSGPTALTCIYAPLKKQASSESPGAAKPAP